MSNVTRRKMLGLAISIPTVALVAGCSAKSATQAATKSASTASAKGTVKITDAWIKAADKDGMTALFGTIEYTGAAGSSTTLESVKTDAAGMCELHETVKDSGKSSMKKVEKGFEIKSGTPFTMAPGGYHVMLMMLPKALTAGEQVKATFTFTGLDPLEVTATVKDFAGANENYGSDSSMGNMGNMGNMGSNGSMTGASDGAH